MSESFRRGWWRAARRDVVTKLAGSCTFAVALSSLPALAQDGADDGPRASVDDDASGEADAVDTDATQTNEGNMASPEVRKQQNMGTQKEEHRAAASGSEAGGEESADAKEEREVGEDDPFDHRFQFGLRVGFVPAYKIIFRYQNPGSETHLCATPSGGDWESQQKICGLVAPPALEVAASFAVLGPIEPYVYGRFGLSAEAQTGTANQLTGGVGTRIYTTTDSRLKFFFEPAVALSFEGYNGDMGPPPGFINTGRTPADTYPTNFDIHLGFGAQYDFARYVGIFANVGVDVGVIRGLSTTLGGNIGVQARFP